LRGGGAAGLGAGRRGRSHGRGADRPRADGAGAGRLPALARREDAGVHGAPGRVRGLEPQDAAEEVPNDERRRAASAARAPAPGMWIAEVNLMDFSPELDVSALQAEAIARGL